jgi:hypothetical protein
MVRRKQTISDKVDIIDQQAFFCTAESCFVIALL